MTLTIHLALVAEDDLAAAAWRVDGQRLLEALLDVRAPHTLGVGGRQVLVIVTVAHVQLALGVRVRARRVGGPRRGNGACSREPCEHEHVRQRGAECGESAPPDTTTADVHTVQQCSSSALQVYITLCSTAKHGHASAVTLLQTLP